MKSYKITTVIEKDEHRYYAFCPDLDGCCTQGRTIDEAMKNIREAVGLYLETLSPRERAAISHHESVTSNIEARVD